MRRTMEISIQKSIRIGIALKPEQIPNGSTATENGGSVVTLQALTLVHVDIDIIDAMLDRFTTVDITHVKSLSLLESAIAGLLRANAGSVEKLTIGKAYSTGCESVGEIDSVSRVLPLLGDLKNLKVLKTIRITIHHNLGMSEDEDEWAKLDRLLVSARSGIELNIYAGFGPTGRHMDVEDVDAVKKLLPLLSMLHIYHNPRCEIGKLFSG
ncbi:hypothetical protein DFH07DRAFT_946549 [Mycena maculata]|uniref:Uncharacterized protein n=1 Tax=Mycena maculata TaxID=230809 RepID=A0AAD7MMT5_9AGAR|nr:hypothetical protein DFH07DRAFT_946549 [Mycena maculata]